MAQRIKKHLFKILPVSVVGIMVFVLAIGIWQGIPVNDVDAAVPTITSLTAKAIDGSGNAKIKVAFSEAVSGTSGGSTALDAADFVLAGTDTPGVSILSVDHFAGTGVAIITLSATINVVGAGELTLDCAATSIYDNNGTNACVPGSPVDISGALLDTTVPNLSTWNLDMNAGTITLNFDEPMDFAVDVDETKLTIQDAATLTTSYTLTTSVGIWTNPATFTVTLSAADLYGINADAGLATSAGDSFLTLASASGLVDAVQNILAAIADGSGVAVTVYTADTTAPVITALVVAPNTGTSKVGDTVTLNIAADAAGYMATNITLNGVNITASNFQDLTGGAYSADYVIADGNADVVSGAITASVVLTDTATNSNVAYTTVTANTLVIDANLPVITALVVAPNTGTLKVGDTVTLNIAADAAGYTATNITLNDVDITASNFLDLTGGAYSADYVISEGDADVTLGAITASVVLTDAATNSNVAFTTVTGNTLIIDANSPAYTVGIVSPASGNTAKVGDSVVINLSAGETGLTASGVQTVNGVTSSFLEVGGGFYSITYIVVEGNADISDAAVLPVNIVFKDAAGNIGNLFTSIGAVKVPGIDANSPTFASVALGADEYVNAIDAMGINISVTTTGVEDGQPVSCTISGTGSVGPVANTITTNATTIATGSLAGLAEGLLTASCTVSDFAGNPAVAGTDTATKDIAAPGFAAVNPVLALLQDGITSPTVPVAMWYYYQGVLQGMKFTIESDEPLSAAYVCTKSIETDDPTNTGLCANDGEFIANSISTTDDALGGNLYRFEIDIDTAFASYPTQVNGYPMNFKLVDAAGNIGYSAGPQHAFTGIWKVNPYYDLPNLDNAGTTDWSQDIPDFTNVTNLSFTMNDGIIPTDLGSLVLNGPLNLTDSSVIDNLASLATDITIGGNDETGIPVIGLDPTLLSELNGGATLSVYVPTAVRPGLVVYADDGTTVLGYVPNDETGSPVVGGDTLSGFSWNSGTQTLTFDTTGFSFFGTDNTAPINQDTVFASDISQTVNTVVTIVSSGDATNNVWFAPNGTTTFVAGATMTKATSGTATTISAPSVVGTYKLYVIDSVGNISAPSTATLTTTAVPVGGGGGYNPPADTTAPTSTSISINSGAVETASQSVTLTLGATDAAQMMIANSADFGGAIWETYAVSKTWVLTGGTGTKTVYAKFKDAAGNISTSISDTINSTATTEIPADHIGLILQDPTPAPALPPQVTIGTLVKLADSGSVYFIDQDNRRHAFPNEAIYLSYYPDFSGVQTLTSAIMAQIPLGSNVTMRPGTWLVKIQSDPKVYAVEPYGVLKGIGSETVAASLYGSAWNTRIVDVEPTFFMNYQMGSAITTAVHPAGSVISYQGDSKVYYVEGGNKRYVSSGVFSHNKFQNMFVIRNVVTSIAYPDGADLPSHGMETIMTLR